MLQSFARGNCTPSNHDSMLLLDQDLLDEGNNMNPSERERERDHRIFKNGDMIVNYKLTYVQTPKFHRLPHQHLCCLQLSHPPICRPCRHDLVLLEIMPAGSQNLKTTYEDVEALVEQDNVVQVLQLRSLVTKIMT